MDAYRFKWKTDSPFLQEMAGLKRSFEIRIRDMQSEPEEWVLHFKPVWEDAVFAFLIKPHEIRSVIRGQVQMCLGCRRLPLILDLDDTLVRVVSAVPADEGERTRLRTLEDGRMVLLAGDAVPFLTWARDYYDVSICSLGEKSYVDQVVKLLDPQRTLIVGEVYSSRDEYMYLQQHPLDKHRPPKDVASIFPFGLEGEKEGEGWQPREGEEGDDVWPIPDIRPLIVDDSWKVWPAEQHDQIIIIKKVQAGASWDVSFLPVIRTTLYHVHDVFFKKLKTWDARMAEWTREREREREGAGLRGKSPPPPPPPSVVGIYKQYLRRRLSEHIADSG